MTLDGSRNSGFLTRTSLTVIVALVVAFTAWSALQPEPEMIGFEAEITLSASTVRGLFRDDCQLDGYAITVFSGPETAVQKDIPVRVGLPTPSGGCTYLVRGEVEAAERYGVRWNGQGGDAFADVWKDHDDVATATDDGEPLVAFDVRW